MLLEDLLPTRKSPRLQYSRLFQIFMVSFKLSLSSLDVPLLNQRADCTEGFTSSFIAESLKIFTVHIMLTVYHILFSFCLFVCLVARILVGLLNKMYGLPKYCLPFHRPNRNKLNFLLDRDGLSMSILITILKLRVSSDTMALLNLPHL